MYNPISDYGLIGDTHSTALIDRDGSIDWLCWPRHDSPSVFARLLDDRRGGSCSLALDRVTGRSRRYLPGTNILETRFETAAGVAVLLDLMPVQPPAALAEEGPDGEAEGRLVRILCCETGSVSGRFEVRPAFDYGRAEADLDAVEHGVLFAAGGHALLATGSEPMAVDGAAARMAFRLGAGTRCVLVLTHGGEGSPLHDVRDALHRLERTRAYWEQWSARCSYQGPYRDAVLRGALCLKLLTYAPSGGIVAAPTTSLPEAVPGNRNYDYRFAWMRDASFTVASFVRLGYTREAAEFLRFLREAGASYGRDLRLMYGIDGDAPEQADLDSLEGWRGVGPVRVGNNAVHQVQSDIYGELLSALRDFLQVVGFDPPQKTNDHLPKVLENLVEAALSQRGRPDQGLWEMPGPPQAMLHSQAMIWVAVTCAAAIGRRIGHPEPAVLDGWEQVGRELREEYLGRGWNEAAGAYTMAYGGTSLDASVLRLVIFDAIDAHDPRLAATLAAVERELGAGDLLYRYRVDDTLQGEEGTFTACAFWRSDVLAMAGRGDEATALFERLLERGNDLGLFAEQIDPVSGEQRGNFPQAFTHMALIRNALGLQALGDSGAAGAA